MNLITIEVPSEVEYISEWKEFEYPQGHLILDKTICGCGFTEYCLTNNIPTILCSPRKTLLENKKKQHKESNVYHFKNNYSYEFYDCENADKIDSEDKEDYLFTIKESLKGWLMPYTVNPQLAPKILVTYDSFHHVKNALGSRINDFAIVVDEFQSIFMDATFKADTEMDFVEELKDCKNVLYLSATPMLENYMCKLDYFKDLDFYKMEWPESRVERVRIERRFTQSINGEIKKLVTRYRNGDFPNKFTEDGIKYSRELVIFVNSVKSICDIIKKCELKPDEVNIICSDTDENRKKLKKVKHEIGEVPVKGEMHKMFTICTRTVYLGSDFYSTSAYTVVCSDANIKTLVVDISLDLPQIIGRQRLKENVFKNEVLFLYKAPTKGQTTANITESDYQKMLDEMEEKTKTLLDGYNGMTEKQKKEWSKVARNRNDLYMDDFLGVSSKTGLATYNYLVRIAKQRAFDVSRKDYQDNISIKRCMESIENCNVDVTDNEVDNEILLRTLGLFNSKTTFKERMEVLCDFVECKPEIFNNNKECFPREYVNYISIVGINKIRALCFFEADIVSEMNSILKIDSNKDNIIDLFEVGKAYTRVEIKKMLSDFYTEHGIKKTPNALDLEDYFEITKSQITNKETGKRDNGFKIIKKK